MNKINNIRKLLLMSLILMAPFIAVEAEPNLGGKFRLANDVYKILTLKEWENASKMGFIVTELDKKDGFVHLSTSSQLAVTLSFFFAQHKQVVLLQLTQDEIKDALVFEAPVPVGERSGLFPHLYSELAVNQVSQVWHLERGAFILPDDVLLQAER